MTADLENERMDYKYDNEYTDFESSTENIIECGPELEETCGPLVQLLMRDGWEFDFSNVDAEENERGVFQMHMDNSVKLIVQNGGEAFFYWESEVFYDKDLMNRLMEHIAFDRFETGSEYRISLRKTEDNGFRVETAQALLSMADGVEFARAIACNLLFFQVDVNSIYDEIQEMSTMDKK